MLAPSRRRTRAPHPELAGPACRPHRPQKGFLKADPRSSASNWRALVQPVAGGLSLEADVSPLAELLNVAWARHEIVSDHTAASLAWLEAGGKKRVGRRRA